MDGGASGVEIRKARPEDAGLVADVLGDAFSDDAMMGWMMGDTRHASAVFKELARRVYLKDGFGHLVGDVAATLWLPAGVEGHLSFLDELAFAAMAFGRAGAGAGEKGGQTADDETQGGKRRKPEEPTHATILLWKRVAGIYQMTSNAVVRVSQRESTQTSERHS